MKIRINHEKLTQMLEIIDKDIKTVAITVFHTLARAKIEHVKYLET